MKKITLTQSLLHMYSYSYVKKYMKTNYHTIKNLFGHQKSRRKCTVWFKGFKQAYYCILITSTILSWSLMLLKKKKKFLQHRACSILLGNFPKFWQDLGIPVIDSWENLRDWQETACPPAGLFAC